MAENKLTTANIISLIDSRIKRSAPEILSSFTIHKITDTPIDDLSVVNRKYITLNGTLANRPVGSVATVGQSYFATDLGSGTKITYNGNQWTNGVGSIITSN